MPPFSLVLAIIATICIPRAFGADPVSLVCNQPPEFVAPTPEGGSVTIRDAEISITYQPDNVVLQLMSETDDAYAFIQNSTIYFKGHANEENIYWSSIGTVSTAGVYSKGDNDVYEVSECRLYLPAKSNRKNVAGTVEATIRRVAASCLADEICKNVAKNKHTIIVKDDFLDARRSVVPSEPELSPVDDSRLNLNLVVDYALVRVKKMMKETGQNTITIPEIHKKFETGAGFLKLTGHFNTRKGQFRDLATLQRTSDAEVVQVKKKYFIAAGFGLSYAHLDIEHYELKFGPVNVDGRFMTNIDGISIAARISVDYGPKQCVKSLDYVKITNMGQITIHLTGLGKLSPLMSMLISSVTKDWKDTIIYNIEKSIQSIAQEQLTKFNCETYRPFA